LGKKIRKGEPVILSEKDLEPVGSFRQDGGSFCPGCGYPVMPDFEYCPKCGQRLIY